VESGVNTGTRPSVEVGEKQLMALIDHTSAVIYMRDVDGVHRAFQIQQLTLGPNGVSHVAAFFDLSLFDAFGLPETL